MAFLKKKKDPFKAIQTCLQKRDYKEALGWFKPLLEKDSKNTQIRLRYADTLVLAGSRKEAIRQYGIVADELAEAGFMIRAIAINKKIVQLDPSKADVHQKLATMNEERSKSSPSRTLPLEFMQPSTSPEPPQIEESPSPAPSPSSESPAEEADPSSMRAPTLSLEESMAMEFGEASKSEAEPESTSPFPPVAEPVSADEDVDIDIDIDIDVDVSDEAQPGESVEFELADEEKVPPGEIEPGDFLAEEESPAFSEEPVTFGEPSTEAEEEEEILEIETIETPAEPEADIEVDIEPVDFQVETEPEMAADGESPLVGLLGDDIDSLIDSIIDDVESSKVGVAAPTKPGQATHIPLFSDLTAAEFVDVAIMLVRRAEKTGTVIVREGDPGDSMFIVSTGEVEATRHEAGRDMKLARLQDGDFFGEMAVLSGEPRSATVTTVKNTELLELKRNDLGQVCSRHPEVEAKLRLAYDERRMKSGT